jgi:acyl carrier protein
MSAHHRDIRSYIVEQFLFGQDSGLTDDSSFLDKGILDSTGVLELVAHLESTYGIKVSDDELLPDNLDSIDAICAFIDRKMKAAAAAAPC